MAHHDTSVVVDRGYFDQLVNRAGLNTHFASGVDGQQRGPAIIVSQDEYDKLRRTARQHATLCKNLLEGGIDQQALDFLCATQDENRQNGYAAEPDAVFQASGNPGSAPRGIIAAHTTSNLLHADAPSFNPSWPKDEPYSPPIDPPHGRQRSISISSSSAFDRDAAYYNPGWAGRPKRAHVPDHAYRNGLTSPPYDNDLVHGHDDHDTSRSDGRDSTPDNADGTRPGVHPGPARPVGPSGGLERTCQRTMQLVALPASATLADVADAVRGGLLLELYIRENDRSAFVSFARESDAKAFFEHAKRHDLYIRNKRVNLRWSDRQFVLLNHIGRKIAVGATRNLVIRNCGTHITEDAVRRDLDHIHKLIVVSVNIAHGNCYISTNSVHNALFAQNCMMSRLTYKGSRIEWMPDECAQPLVQARPILTTKPAPVAQTRRGFAGPNRFQLLNIDGVRSDDDDDDDDDDANGNGMRL